MCEYIQRHGKARVGGQHSSRCRDPLVAAIRTTDDGYKRIAAHEVRSAGYDVVREEFNERQRVRAELIHASRAQRSAAWAARGEAQELGGATVRDPLPVHPPLRE